MTFANGTAVRTPAGLRPIEQIAKDDPVLGGFVGAGTPVRLNWQPRKTVLSAGTGGGVQPAMIYLVFGDGSRNIVCTRDQLFMRADGTLMRAERAVPGDQLLDADSRPVAIQQVSVGQYSGGVHHIALEGQWDGTVNGHLIVAGGLVAGDYLLQVHYVDNAPSPARPSIGTSAYRGLFARLIARITGRT
jgi:hypothetical protein